MQRCSKFPDFEIFQYVFSQDKGARQACLAPVACGASTPSHDDHSCNIRARGREHREHIWKSRMDELKRLIRDIPDFPKPGIVFKDITTLLSNKRGFSRAIDTLANRYIDRDIDLVVGIESRGFIVGAALAYRLGAGVILVRKPGKLPFKTHSTIYELEYGTDQLEIHQDAIKPGQQVLIADDLIATGGTIKAAVDLVEKLKGNIVECAFLIELEFLKGRKKLDGYPVFSLLKF